ncbi:hypothetical protein [Aurantiacibacter sediminis]|uniref:hypothetical protein n=1 Tax=Aurantiacibacter sediminis TaxID=2793064 RepID=UPI0018D928D3
MKSSVHPFVRGWRIFFAGIGMPILVLAAWYKAWSFDPYSEIFFTRFFVQPTPEMPGEIRIAGWLFLGLGILLAAEPAIAALVRRMNWKQAALMAWLGGLTAAFGGAFFVAADAAESKIEQRIAHGAHAA